MTGTPLHRLAGLLDALALRFPDAHPPLASDSPEENYLRAIDALRARLAAVEAAAGETVADLDAWDRAVRATGRHNGEHTAGDWPALVQLRALLAARTTEGGPMTMSGDALAAKLAELVAATGSPAAWRATADRVCSHPDTTSRAGVLVRLLAWVAEQGAARPADEEAK